MKNNPLDRSLIYRSFRRTLQAQFSPEIADAIWADAGACLQKLRTQHPDVSGDNRMMILPAAALYQALRAHTPEHALSLLQDYGTAVGNRIAKVIHAVTCIPGVPRLLWKFAPALMRKTSSPKAGYTRRIVSETRELVGVDILSCPLHDCAIKIGVPEAAQAVCAMDKAYMTGFRHIRYTRTTSVAEGGECCDYRLSYDATKH